MITYLSDKRTISVCVLTVFVAVCTLSLLTYYPFDPSFFFITSHAVKTANWCGNIGAHIAATLFFLCGSAAFFLVLLLWIFLYAFFNHQIKGYKNELIAGTILFFLLTMTEAVYKATWIQHGFIPGGFIGENLTYLALKIGDPILVHVFLGASSYAAAIVILNFVGIGYVKKLVDVTQWLICEKMVLQKCFRALLWFIKYSGKGIANVFIMMCTGKGITKEEILPDEFQEFMNEYSMRELNNVHTEESSEGVHVQECIEESKPFKEEKPEQAIHHPKNTYILPSKDLFDQASTFENARLKDDQQELAQKLEEKLQRFGIVGSVISIKSGPVVTLFEYQPHIDAKISKIMALEDDLALALEATSIRIIAPIPGTSVVGFEVARKVRQAVPLASIIHSQEYSNYEGALPLILGVDTVGRAVIADLGAMPHLLVAGATGSGKSVALNVFLISLLLRYSPCKLKLILIDPKRLEFAPYADIAHLLFPIITQSKEAVLVLQWLVSTMEQRYEQMAHCGVRNIADYNSICHKYNMEQFPYMVLMIDELADLMMITGKEIEDYIARLAQMARAAGIHLIIATQRPSVDVITGIIKANFPSRISFRVATKIDARTILDTVGAEKLLGKGDMLYLDVFSKIHRIHGAFVFDQEVEKVVSHIRSMQRVEYLDIQELVHTKKISVEQADETLYNEVLAFLQTVDEVSISLIQRKFKIGYNRSARIIETLESEGRILSIPGSKMRKVIHADS